MVRGRWVKTCGFFFPQFFFFYSCFVPPDCESILFYWKTNKQNENPRKLMSTDACIAIGKWEFPSCVSICTKGQQCCWDFTFTLDLTFLFKASSFLTKSCILLLAAFFFFFFSTTFSYLSFLSYHPPFSFIQLCSYIFVFSPVWNSVLTSAFFYNSINHDQKALLNDTVSEKLLISLVCTSGVLLYCENVNWAK